MKIITTKAGFLEIMRAKRILTYLQNTKQGFCFVNGQIVSIEDCLAIINKKCTTQHTKIHQAGTHQL